MKNKLIVTLLVLFAYNLDAANVRSNNNQDVGKMSRSAEFLYHALNIGLINSMDDVYKNNKYRNCFQSLSADAMRDFIEAVEHLNK